ncbi:MAG: glycine dehydrogenase, partial [Sphingomonadaceae bacterium]
MSVGEFLERHLAVDAPGERAMLAALGAPSRAALVEQALPASIRQKAPLELPTPLGEAQALAALRAVAGENEIWRSYLGTGYHACHTPQVIQRNLLENPGWYTAYTPYQPEISQGRLEALLVFQQTVSDLTGLPVANASLLDEATAAAEAMALIRRAAKSKAQAFFADAGCHPQVLAVLATRAKWMGIPLVVGDPARIEPGAVFGAHLQYPNTWGGLSDYSAVISSIHAAGGLVSLGTDPLALVLLESPGALGADLALGSAQRFGVPLGYGGPHAAYMSCRMELVRQMPGRIIGASVDAAGRTAYRMALQTREQHIRREKATSNICTSQVLLANIAGMYAVWHGPEGLARIAQRCNLLARRLAAGVAPGLKPLFSSYFETLAFEAGEKTKEIQERARQKQINLRYDGSRVGVALDETTTEQDIRDLAWV